MRLSAREVRVATSQTHLDEFAPIYQFGEFHSIAVSAPKERIFGAIKSVTASEILFFRTLTWIRRFGRPGAESILNPPAHEPLLDVANFKTILEPGFVLAAMNFIVEETGPGACTVTTETRVYATETQARRRFGAYWRVIYPGSALIRRMWLRAVAPRAESSSG